jgi:hypothetical protein
LKKHITAVHEDKKPDKCNICENISILNIKWMNIFQLFMKA